MCIRVGKPPQNKTKWIISLRFRCSKMAVLLRLGLFRKGGVTMAFEDRSTTTKTNHSWGKNTTICISIYTPRFLIVTIVYLLTRQQKGTRSSCYKMAALCDLLHGAVLATTALNDDIPQKPGRFTFNWTQRCFNIKLKKEMPYSRL